MQDLNSANINQIFDSIDMLQTVGECVWRSGPKERQFSGRCPFPFASAAAAGILASQLGRWIAFPAAIIPGAQHEHAASPIHIIAAPAGEESI